MYNKSNQNLNTVMDDIINMQDVGQWEIFYVTVIAVPNPRRIGSVEYYAFEKVVVLQPSKAHFPKKSYRPSDRPLSWENITIFDLVCLTITNS